MRSLVLIVAAVLFVAPAHAAGFDCKRAATQIERQICGDPDLSRADEELAAAYASELSATLMPQAARAEQQGWIRMERDSRAGSAGALLDAYAKRLSALETQTSAWRTAVHKVPIQWARDHCLLLPGAGLGLQCRVTQFARVLGDTSGRLFFQLQSYGVGNDYATSGEVVFRKDDGSTADIMPIAAAYMDDIAEYDRARVIISPTGRLLLLPGVDGGTGNVNIDALFLFKGSDHLEDIDTDSWLNAFVRKLPEGVEYLSGIHPDYKTMTAKTPLANAGDSNCCPTAGTAFIRLALSGRTLVLKDVSFHRAQSTDASP